MGHVTLPDIKGAPGATRTDDLKAVPVSIGDKIFSICVGLRPGKLFDRNKFDARLKEYLADGKLTKDEFAELLGLDDTGGVSDQFWNLFTSGEEINDLQEFLSALAGCKECLDMTGETLPALARSTNIMPVSREQLADMVKNMGLTQKDLANPYLRRMLERAKAIGGDSDKTGFENLSQKTWELLAFGLYREFTLSGAWREMGFDDIKKLDVADPWVAERFGLLFQKYVKGADGKPGPLLPTKDELNALLSYQEKVTAFREWADENNIGQQAKLLQDFDPLAKEGDRYVIDIILEDYEDKGSAWVLEQLGKTEYSRKAVPQDEGEETPGPIVNNSRQPAAQYEARGRRNITL